MIAATHRDVPTQLASSEFRTDLHCRLCAHTIRTPSLAEQLAQAPEDLQAFVEHVVERALGTAEDEAGREEAGDIGAARTDRCGPLVDIEGLGLKERTACTTYRLVQRGLEMIRWHAVFMATLTLLGGCASAKLTSTGPAAPPRESNCDFAMLTTPPAGGYTEIGTLDITKGFWGDSYTELDDLKKGIQKQVCEAGGDAVIAYANGYGRYVKASVLKRTASAAPAPQAAAPAPQPAATPASPVDDGGCRYDTQCKGERICVSGECVDPSASPAATVPAATAEVAP